MRIDPMCEDPRPQEDREEEDARTARWEDFIGRVLDWRATWGEDRDWGDIVESVADAMHDPDGTFGGAFKAECNAFAETEGWDGVLNAVAKAYREFENRRRRDLERC